MATFEGRELACLRGERLVLNGTAFRVDSGTVLVLAGANGTGKSTLLRLMAGLMRPSGGTLLWDGVDVAEDRDAHRARLAYVGHADAVKPALSVIENARFWADVSGAGGQSAEQALESLEIGHLADLPARYLSAGQRRRLGLTRMLTSAARLWLLDEPTTALDADSSQRVAALIDGHRKAGGMAVVSTHLDLGVDGVETLRLGTR